MKIVVYIEPSDRGGWALAPSIDLARSLGGTIVLLTTEQNLKDHPKLLDEAAAKFSGAKNVAIEKKSRPGPARKAILEESRESRPGITVFPPAGRGSLIRMLRGSRVKAVVHKSPSSVMVARKPVSDHIRRILVTVSGGPFSETTVLSAHEIAHAMNAELTVLHVASSVAIPFAQDEVAAGGASGGAAAEKAGGGGRAIHDLLESLSQQGIEPKVRRRNGMVVHEIVLECEEGHYDLLVLGQHLADKASGGPLSENIAEILAMECPIPVLVVRPRRWAAGPVGEK